MTTELLQLSEHADIVIDAYLSNKNMKEFKKQFGIEERRESNLIATISVPVLITGEFEEFEMPVEEYERIFKLCDGDRYKFRCMIYTEYLKQKNITGQDRL